EPVPSPSRMPDSTYATARSAAARFCASRSALTVQLLRATAVTIRRTPALPCASPCRARAAPRNDTPGGRLHYLVREPVLLHQCGGVATLRVRVVQADELHRYGVRH